MSLHMLSDAVSCSALLVWQAERVKIEDVNVKLNKVFKYDERSHQGSHFDRRSIEGLVLLSQILWLNLKSLSIWSCITSLSSQDYSEICECYHSDKILALCCFCQLLNYSSLTVQFCYLPE